jgi:hypothetical protein
VIGGFVAATVVALVQYVRTRDRRLLPLVLLFVLQALSLGGEPGSLWKSLSQAGVILAGVVLVLILPGRPAGPSRG